MTRKAGTVSLAPRKVKGWVHELKVPLAAGETLRYEARHSRDGGDVEFNVHSHEGAKVTYHARGTESSVAGTFVAPWTGDFYLMWENTSERSVPVTYAVERLPSARP